MRALVERAAGHDVVLAHENEQGIYGDTPERCLDIVESVGSEQLRLVWDPGNFVVCGRRPHRDGYALLRPHLAYVHVKDVRVRSRQRRGGRRPGGRGRRRDRRDDPRAARRWLRRLLLARAAPRDHGRRRRVQRRRAVRGGARARSSACSNARGSSGVTPRRCASRSSAPARSAASTPTRSPRSRRARRSRSWPTPRAQRAGALAAAHGAAGRGLVGRRRSIGATSTPIAICTPSGGHAALAVAALDAGRHVVVEKPLDVTVEAARTVADAAARSDRTVTVISQHRFDPAARLVHERVAAGRARADHLGRRERRLVATQDYYDSGDWRGTWALDGGGALMNQGIHTLDLLVWLLGEPVEVFGWSDRLAHERIEVEDTVVATIRFASGALGRDPRDDRRLPGRDRAPRRPRRPRLGRDRGRPARLLPRRRRGRRRRRLRRRRERQPGAGAAARPSRGRSRARIRARSRHAPTPTSTATSWTRSSSRRPPLVTVADAIRNIAVIRAIYESAATGRRSRSRRLPRALTRSRYQSSKAATLYSRARGAAVLTSPGASA